MDESKLGRRSYLTALLATGTVTGLAGCSSSQDDSTTNTSTEAPNTPSNQDSSQDDSVTNTTTDAPNTPSNQDSSTPTQNQAPQILAHEATPQDNGTSLAVHLEGKDDTELSLARIEYGEQTIERTPDSASVTIDDELIELGDVALNQEPGHVTFLLRDSAGRETRTETVPDDTAPQLHTFTLSPTENAGELLVTLQGRDNEGIETLSLHLDGNSRLQRDTSGQKETAVDTTISVSDNATVGEENTLTAMLEDWNGNTTESDSNTYVRKFNKMEDTRLSFGAVYQAFNWDFKDDRGPNIRDSRTPDVGKYAHPIEEWVFKRHMDQMQGHGINRLMITISGDDNTKESSSRLLNTDFVSEMEIEPWYDIITQYWGKEHPESAESYRKDLVEPDMNWIKDNIILKDNVSTHNGRPIMQTWGSNLLVRDYQHNKIMDEFGSYEAFIQEMRDILTVDGNDPYLVGGANWFGAAGYPDRGSDMYKQFDAVMTWVAGGAWANNKDNETTKEEVLEYTEENFQGHRKFTDQHDIDFVPTVFPGFNELKGNQKRHPRSPELLEGLLKLAEEYRTTDMVNSSAYNQWEEMTTLEPGTFKQGPFGNESYGTAYLDVVKKFQDP